MKLFSFPVSIADIKKWCQDNNLKPHEGRQRYAEYAILSCIAADVDLSKAIVFKGGNALRFFFKSPRSTLDLDFSVAENNFPDDEYIIREKLTHALRRIERGFNVKAKCQRVKRNPTNNEATRPTYDVKIGYVFPDDAYYLNFDDRIVSTVIPLEISLNDKVCEYSSRSLAINSFGKLRICILEDILAEKLRALLQQPLRNRNREQDVFDIAWMFRENKDKLDFQKISKFLQEKSEIRDVEAKRSAFDAIVRQMAELEYEIRIREQTGEDFIPFEDAWLLVLDLVGKLDIPD